MGRPPSPFGRPEGKYQFLRSTSGTGLAIFYSITTGLVNLTSGNVHRESPPSTDRCAGPSASQWMVLRPSQERTLQPSY
jgi:hypothetical protein